MGAAASRAEHTRDGTVRKRGTFGREERLEGRNVCKERLEGRNVWRGGERTRQEEGAESGEAAAVGMPSGQQQQ